MRKSAQCPARTSLKKITELRDEAFTKYIKEVAGSAFKGRFNSQAIRGFVLAAPSTFDLNVEGHGAIEGITMTVLATKPCTPLYVEATPQNLQFLCSVVKSQYASGEIHRKHIRMTIPETVDSGEVNVSFRYKDERFRVKYEDEAGKPREKSIPTKQLGILEALQLAKSFVQDPSKSINVKQEITVKLECESEAEVTTPSASSAPS